MGTKKITTKKSPIGAPLGNPLKFFRESGEKRKAMFKNGGYNIPNNSLPRKDNGGPGSGMGRMYLDDLANEAMMAQPSTPPAPPREKPGLYGNTTPGEINEPSAPTMRELIGSSNSTKMGPYGNTTPGNIKTPLIRKKGGAIKRKK